MGDIMIPCIITRMRTFYLTPTAISDLALFIFAAFSTGYLTWLTWHLRKKRPFQLLTITLSFTFVSGYILLDFLNQTLYPDLRFWILPMQSVVMTFGIVWLLQFAYRMPELYPERRRESRIALGVTMLLPLWEIGPALRRYADLQEGIVTYRPGNADYALTAVLLWVLLVYFRQMGRADERPLPLWRKFLHPKGRAARSAQRLSLVSLMPVGLTAVLLLQSKADLPTTITSVLLSVGLLFTMLLFALVYLDYLPEQTTFMVRLTAVTLAFFLVTLGVVGQVMTPSFIASYDNHDVIAAPQTVHFTPNTEGGYDISQIPYIPASLDAQAIGEKLLYGDEWQKQIALPFDFPFYDQNESTLYVNWDGAVHFTDTPPHHTDSLFHYGSIPSIYLTGAAFQSGASHESPSGIYAHTTPQQVTLTWLDMAESGNDENRHTVQLRLFAAGDFEMTFIQLPQFTQYDMNTRWHTLRLTAVLSGTPYAQPEYIHFSSDLPFSSKGDGIAEDYHHDFRVALHDFLTPLFWLILFSAFFVPVGLFLVLRQNVVQPLKNLLKGVKQINDGDLNIHIPVQVEDEFGYLTHAFNRMSAELGTMVVDLEDRVAIRTAQLAETSTYLDNILRNATDYAIVTVDRELHVTYINPAAETLYDISAAEVMGKMVTIIPAQEIDSERFKVGLQTVSTHGIHQYNISQKMIDGTRHISARLSGIFDEHGTLLGYVHFSRDISERVETEHNLQMQQRSLAAMEERERIGRELHDGIGQIMGYLNLQLQASRALLADSQQEAVDALLAQLITVTQKSHNDVREFILGIKKPATALTDFWTALQQLTDTFEAQYHMSILLSLPADAPPWLLPPRDFHMLRLIREALTNVYKHADATQVQIIATQITPNQAQFIISDNGCGFTTTRSMSGDSIVLEEAPHSPLPTADSPNHHFGLNIMHERAIELNGRLEIRTAPDQGTQLVVTIAIQPEDEKTAVSYPTSPLRILLVDDHSLFRDGMGRLLETYGVQIVGTAGNGLEAQDVVRETNPDIVLMDIHMPVCDGIEATKRIKAEFPDQRIIMLTVSAEDDTLFAALKAGASGYLLKSMEIDELFILIAGLDKGHAPPIAPELAGKVMAEFQRLMNDKSELNERQSRILELVANGRSYREIATNLYLSERTVKRDMKQIMDILHLDSRTEAEAYARRRA